ncbi:MAG: type III pantothenate kinase [Bacteroidia bacterium]|nr:MAG: type III pantothenate kinase [Bacteroidia bacterium]
MNLVVDIGNTRIKIALYKDNLLHKLFVFNSFQELQQNSDLKNDLKNVSQGIISNVAQKDLLLHLQNHIPPHVQLIPLSLENIRLPFQIDYHTPHTLGSDRIAAIAGCVLEFDTTPSLVIDLGTCIKYNFINNNTIFGGAISPGLLMRYKALHHYTGQLPLLHPDNNVVPILGKNTHENIHSGVINGCVAEIMHFINFFEKNLPDLKIILTGGDAIFFEKLLERKVFLRPYLILDGLNYLLEYQKAHFSN